MLIKDKNKWLFKDIFTNILYPVDIKIFHTHWCKLGLHEWKCYFNHTNRYNRNFFKIFHIDSCNECVKKIILELDKLENKGDCE